MKCTQSWVRNKPSSAAGYSITIKYTYTSMIESEIDEIEKKLPKGILIFDLDSKSSESMASREYKMMNNGESK